MDPGALDEPKLARLIEVGRALVARLDLEGVLQTVLGAARELTGARYAALGIIDGDKRELERFLTLGIDERGHAAIGGLPRGRGVLGELMRAPGPLRLSDLGRHPGSFGFPAGHPSMRTFLGVAIRIHGEAWGSIYLTEKDGGGDFDEQDEAALAVLADWAAIAIETARSVEAERLRHSLEAAERERNRWARELHDETLQAFGGLRMLYSAALRSGAGAAEQRAAIEQGIELIDVEIDNLSALIAELRPPALDQIGLVAALHGLADRKGREGGLAIDVLVRLGGEDGGRLPGDLESTLYRIVQEALSNVGKHAGASRAEVLVERDGDRIEVAVRDDGGGFDPPAAGGGFGLTGMRERVELVGGELRIESEPGRGTAVLARIPVAGGVAQRSSSS